jgi:hypothetical protein
MSASRRQTKMPAFQYADPLAIRLSARSRSGFSTNRSTRPSAPSATTYP